MIADVDAVHPVTTPLPLLTGYDAKRCQRRVHNDHDATLDAVPWEVPADLQQRFDAGKTFEGEVFAALDEAVGPDRRRDLSGLSGKQRLVDATVEAMEDGVELILGGWLPDDESGGRAGRPDLLLRIGEGYVPGDVKWHKTVRTARSGRLRYSLLVAPTDVKEADGLAPRTTERIDDFLQLAHYWRMLETIGRAAPQGGAWGFIIGTDQLVQLDPAGFTLTWLPLDVPLFTTYSRSRGTAKRTALERYDFEHGIRLEIARVAESRTGAPDDPEPLVDPIFSQECDVCPWHDYCHALAGDAASAHIRVGRLDVREWRALGRLGVSTLEQLASLDLDDPGFQAAYLPEVTHQAAALPRLATAVRRATMARAGVAIERETTGPLPVPRADIEIDFDIEDAEGFVYLWGALVRDGDSEPTFQPTVSWDALDAASERAMALAFVDWLRGIRDRAAAEGRTVLAYHYTSYEIDALRRILGADAVGDVMDLFVDLHAIVAEHYFGVAGLGLKKVAPAFGFHWRDDEPNGLLSQLWYLDATQTDDPGKATAARERLLAYNEDDVRATLAVRDGIAGD